MSSDIFSIALNLIRIPKVINVILFELAKRTTDSYIKLRQERSEVTQMAHHIFNSINIFNNLIELRNDK